MKSLLTWVTILILLLVPLTIPETSAVKIDTNVSVEINPNAELLGIVYYLAFGKDPFVVDRGSYLTEVEDHFGKFRDSKAVLLLKSYISRGRSVPEKDYLLMGIEYYLLLCSDPPELEPMTTLGYPWFENEFLPALREFARESDFMGFYDSHMDYYREDLRIYENALKMLPPDEFMARNAGVRNVTYEFLHPYLVAVHGHSFSPAINGTEIWGAGGMLPLVRRTPQRTLWSCKTARDTMFGLPLNRDYLVNEGLNELLYLAFVYHELGHDVTVPALNSYRNLSSLPYLTDVIRRDMPYLAVYDIHFWDDYGMIYEGFADGWEDFAMGHVDPEYAEVEMWMQRGWGEFWIDEMVELYGKYANKSVHYGVDIQRYIPNMAKELRERVPEENASLLYQQRVPVTPLRAFDRGAVTGKVVVVYGTQNPDPKGAEYDRETAELIADNLRTFYSQWNGSVEIVVKADVNVTEDELGENLVLVGGPAANSVVAEMQEHFPLRFVKEGNYWVIEHSPNWSADSFIITENESDPVVKGQLNLSDSPTATLLLAVRNPNNPENYIVWIAGADRYGTRLFRNPTYYLSSYEIFTGKGIEMGFYV
ncbi:DUF4932 domain-containing protein [Thermococcus sp. 21S7]|uniref:DUF4932 domain-containing protein n=1 Tax=Thermococcus sp. 21S7 TaxID=1638221 RepID=UPI00143CB8FD|nr:DUF4932 domain-containing protein [Thermococcus sp. 21S7]NJE61080.1 DUF4932 domain-containing protein [Thermococcus sp. 21S7]